MFPYEAEDLTAMNIRGVNWVEFPPRNGHVQTGRRPAIIAQDAFLLNDLAPDPSPYGLGRNFGFTGLAMRLKRSSTSPRDASTGHDYNRS